ncbi:MAG: hypothetical protein AAFN79_15535 [Pseudomonadota bacterium]
MRKSFAALTAVIFTAACANKAEDVSAAYVSPTGYQGFTCEELVTEREGLKERISVVAAEQDSKAGGDAAAVAVGAIVFLPALLFLAAGDDKSGELSRLKGEFDAVTEVAVEKDCIPAEQIAEERAQAEAAQREIEEKRKSRDLRAQAVPDQVE